MNNLVVSLILVVVTGIIFSIVPNLLKGKLSPSLTRNIVHCISYIICAVAIAIVLDRTYHIIIGLLSLISLIIIVEKNLTPQILFRNRYRDYGLVFSVIGYVSLSAFFHDNITVIFALLVTGFADPLASIIGRLKGKKFITLWNNNKKSIEGFLAFVAITFAIYFIFYLNFSEMNNISLLYGLFIAVSVGLIELISPSAIDNFLIQISAAFLFSRLFF